MVTKTASLLNWLSTHPRLDNRKCGIVCADFAILWHGYSASRDNVGVREKVDNFLFIEGSESQMGVAQREKFNLFQLLLNERRKTRWIKFAGRMRFVKFWGHYKLGYNGATPEESSQVKWNGIEISVEELLEVLRFERSPETLKRIDKRLSHRARSEVAWKKEQPMMLGFEQDA